MEETTITITVPADAAKALDGCSLIGDDETIELVRLAIYSAASWAKAVVSPASCGGDDRSHAAELLDLADRIGALARVYGIYAARKAELDEDHRRAYELLRGERSEGVA